MKIIDTVPFFIHHYEPSIKFLRNYYNEYPDIFKEYFSYHCKDTDERLEESLVKYPEWFSTIKEVHEKIKPIILEVTEQYTKLYQIHFPIEINLIVGGFGSNAYTHRQIIPNITFALEKLTPESDFLRTIVAHEFGHVTHNILTNRAGMNWKELQWSNPLIWLYQEGAATHFSRKTVKDLHPSVYFSFNDEGQQWLAFSEKNKQLIKTEFIKDLESEQAQEIFKEWFSINGGQKLGYSRLAYFIGDHLFQRFVHHLGEDEAIIAWKEDDFLEMARHLLNT